MDESVEDAGDRGDWSCCIVSADLISSACLSVSSLDTTSIETSMDSTSSRSLQVLAVSPPFSIFFLLADSLSLATHLGLNSHDCFFTPGPPYFFISRQNLHFLQSGVRQHEQLIHRPFLPLTTSLAKGRFFEDFLNADFWLKLFSSSEKLDDSDAFFGLDAFDLLLFIFLLVFRKGFFRETLFLSDSCSEDESFPLLSKPADPSVSPWCRSPLGLSSPESEPSVLLRLSARSREEKSGQRTRSWSCSWGKINPIASLL